ncbi:MAG TPA: sialidase family protein [Chloroflexota bacterium]|jgi:predicted neuraminidase|nr:sialidase family protein [Chloroflexota bacterium]
MPLIEKRFLHTFGAAWPRAIGPALTIAPNGDWLCHWISGPQPERDGQPGLSAVYKRSPDGGQTWGQLRVWIEPDAPDRCGHGHPNYVQDGEIVAFGLTFDSGPGRMARRRPFRLRSQDSGHTWSPPEPLHDRVGVVTRGGRVVLQDGSWVFPQHYVRPPDVPWEVLHFRPELREARDLSAWTWGVNVLRSTDGGRTLLPGGPVEPSGAVRMNEPHAIQLRDGTLVLLCRADKDGYLWRTESGDGGLSWAPPWRTEIPNPASKVWLARLTDGRIALVHNPSPTARDPLSLWLSEDEMRTWPVRVELDSWSANEAWFTRRPGAGPSTALAYPHAVQAGGTLHVVYDLGRRDVVHLAIDLARL